MARGILKVIGKVVTENKVLYLRQGWLNLDSKVALLKTTYWKIFVMFCYIKQCFSNGFVQSPLFHSGHVVIGPQAWYSKHKVVNTVFLKNFIWRNSYISWFPVQCDRCAWRPSPSFEILGEILVRYSVRSPCLRINKRFLCFESVKVTAEVNSMIVNWS